MKKQKKLTPKTPQPTPQNKKQLFLSQYSVLGTIPQAAKAADIDRKTHYNWLRSDPEYAELFERAKENYLEKLEAGADRRGVEGTLRPVFHQVEECGQIRKFSDTFLMKSWIKIAFRNLFKNRRRSLFTILAIGLGFAAVNVFGGFTSYMFTNLEDSYIYAQANAHITIFKRDFLTKGKLDPVSFLLTEGEMQRIQQVAQSFPDVLLVTAQLHISGLVSNGKVSTVFLGAGRVPSHVRFINGHAKSAMIAKLKLFDGKPLDDNSSYGIGLSSGLAEQLNLKIGSDVIAMAPTIRGQINALDVQVFQLFSTAIEVLNDKLMFVPLKFAQLLYDTTSVDRVSVLLDDSRKTELMRGELARAMAGRGLEVDIKTWKELDPFYTRIKDMFDIMFLFIFVIVFIVAVMSIVNTMSMAVLERTREIGTLRALGMKRPGIVRMFAIESAMLGALGSTLGIGLTILSWFLVNIVIQPTWVPPVMTRRIPLEVYLVPEYMLYSGFFLVLLAVGAAILPARRAANQEITNALGHV
jgi:putative ABC transport system permease protein